MTDYILVPMQMDVMVLTEQASKATPFLRFTLQYKNLQSFNSAEPPPFEGASPEQPTSGIYLTLTLPKALRSSIPKEDAGVQLNADDDDDTMSDFPLTPNRFLVARVQAGVSPETAIKAWILVSDYHDASTGTSPYVDPFNLDKNGVPIPTKIGEYLDFDATLSSLPDTGQAFLTAAGPGNSTFSVYSPGIDNVFAFYDPVTGIDTAEFSYYVIGWYANPSDDPLQNTSWDINTIPEEEGSYLNNTFDWIIYPQQDETIPSNTLVHTLVSGVPWNRSDQICIPTNYPEDIPDTVKVGFGNTSSDALAAINANANDPQAQTEADFLAAFQYNALDKYDQPASSEQLNIEMREHWYGASSGGTLWSILPREPEQSTALPVEQTFAITPEQKTALDTLNVAQEDYDREQRILQSMQYRLYTLWWKFKWQQKNTIPIDDLDYTEWLGEQLDYQVNGSAEYQTWYIDKVRAQQVAVTNKASEIETKRQAVETTLDSKTQWLQPTNKPQYYYANDPVLLTTGLQRAYNYDPTGNIVCRFIRQTINSLTVNGVTYGIDDSAQQNIADQIPVLTDPNDLLPNGTQQLNIENFFLSPALFAQNILGDVNAADAVSAAIAALPPPAADNHFPPPEFARPIWIQPWIPLLLDWKITLFKEPAYVCEKGEATAKFIQQNWQFDGRDYLWTGDSIAQGEDYNETASQQFELMGRTFVGPYVPSTLSDQVDTLNQSLAQFGATLGPSEDDDDLQQLDVLSQRLSGLMGTMVQRNYASNVAPSGDIATAIGSTYQGCSKPFPSEVSNYMPPPWDFAPMRGSFFVVNKLTIIDSFGRTLDLLQANYSAVTDDLQPDDNKREDYFYPIADDELKASTTVEPYAGIEAASSPTQRMLKLTPRFIQDAQLAFNLTANDASNNNVDTSANNPVCGWLVANHLNRSLAVYAPDGQAWGEMYLALYANNLYQPVWQPNPMLEDKAPQTIDEIPNIYVRALLSDLMARTDNGQSFNDFMKAIDQTLWSVDPEGKRQDANLDVLIGRPLALVRCSLALKLKGLAYLNQDWWNTFAVTQGKLPAADQPAELALINGGVFDDTWPVRLGSQELSDDGLIGYYLDNAAEPSESFHYFNCVELPGTVSSDYLKKIMPDNYIDLRFTDDETITPDASNQEIAYATLLIDPRGECHAYSGLLPVYTKLIPDEFVKPALKILAYLFRAGPIITPAEEASLPKPAEDQGVWSWYDETSKNTIPLSVKTTKVRFMTPPPLAKQGWVKFTPDVNDVDTKEGS
jgi:hypothetical protein